MGWGPTGRSSGGNRGPPRVSSRRRHLRTKRDSPNRSPGSSDPRRLDPNSGHEHRLPPRSNTREPDQDPNETVSVQDAQPRTDSRHTTVTSEASHTLPHLDPRLRINHSAEPRLSHTTRNQDSLPAADPGLRTPVSRPRPRTPFPPAPVPDLRPPPRPVPHLASWREQRGAGPVSAASGTSRVGAFARGKERTRATTYDV